MVTEKMTQESSRNTHHVKPHTISSTLSMTKFKKNIKPKTTKYQSKITKETVPYLSSEPLQPNDICLYHCKASSNLAEPQLYFLIKNVYKPHKAFDFPETDQHFRFVWFQEFPWLIFFIFSTCLCHKTITSINQSINDIYSDFSCHFT